MGPKFDQYLYFQSNGELEVCGPTNFGVQDMLLTVKSVAIKDHTNKRVAHTFKQPGLLFGNGNVMWEGDLPTAKAKRLSVGPARAHGKGRVLHQDGTSETIEWANDVILVNPATFLNGP